jgi:molybdopterin-guanine dinucleotide biosynthesis protein A
VAPISGLVLAGGRSRRMGRDKALLAHGAGTQLSHAVHLLESLVHPVYVSTRADQADEPERRQFKRITDRYEDIGPIAGVLSAMDHDPHSAWLVLACDLPNVDATTLLALLAARAPERPFTAFRSSHDGLPEPLCAIFEPAARAIIDAFVGEGIVCPRKMQIRSDTQLIEQPDPAALDNINTPDDLQRSQERAMS